MTHYYKACIVYRGKDAVQDLCESHDHDFVSSGGRPLTFIVFITFAPENKARSKNR